MKLRWHRVWTMVLEGSLSWRRCRARAAGPISLVCPPTLDTNCCTPVFPGTSPLSTAEAGAVVAVVALDAGVGRGHRGAVSRGGVDRIWPWRLWAGAVQGGESAAAVGAARQFPSSRRGPGNCAESSVTVNKSVAPRRASIGEVSLCACSVPGSFQRPNGLRS